MQSFDATSGFIGAAPSSRDLPTQHFSGMMTDLRVWNHALTADQVVALWAATAPGDRSHIFLKDDHSACLVAGMDNVVLGNCSAGTSGMFVYDAQTMQLTSKSTNKCLRATTGALTCVGAFQSNALRSVDMFIGAQHPQTPSHHPTPALPQVKTGDTKT